MNFTCNLYNFRKIAWSCDFPPSRISLIKEKKNHVTFLLFSNFSKIIWFKCYFLIFQNINGHMIAVIPGFCTIFQKKVT